MTTPRRTSTQARSRSNGRTPPLPNPAQRQSPHPDDHGDTDAGFGMVHGAALKTHNLRPTALSVYVWLCCEAYADVATISLHKLAALTHTSPTTVCRALQTLNQLGLVHSQTHNDARGSHLATRHHLPLLTPHFQRTDDRRAPGRPWQPEPGTPPPLVHW